MIFSPLAQIKFKRVLPPVMIPKALSGSYLALRKAVIDRLGKELEARKPTTRPVLRLS